ncbi:unnamed protein product [Dicrocoelium dendriticum]|nr:unnamed protein product [Dicrocoelium dendriticum]
MCSSYLMSDSTAANLAKETSTTTHDELVYGYTHSHRWVTMDYADQRSEMPKQPSILPSCTDIQAHPLECCQSMPQTRSYSSDSLEHYCRAQFASFKHRHPLNGINKCIPERHDVHQDTCLTSVLEAGDECLKELAHKNVNLKKQDSYRHDDLQIGGLVSSSVEATPQDMDKTYDNTSMVTISSPLAVSDVRQTNSQHFFPKSSLIHTKSLHDIRLEGQFKDLLGLSRAYSSLRSNALGVPKYKPNKNGIIMQKRRTLSSSSLIPLEYQSLFGVSEFLQQQQRQQPPQQQQQQQQHDACQAFLASLAVLRVSFNSELTAGQCKTSRKFMNSQAKGRVNVCERIIPVKAKTRPGRVELQSMSLARFPHQFDVANSGIGRVSDRIEHSRLEMTNACIGVPMSDPNYQTACALHECDKHETVHNSLSDVVEASNQSENESAQKHKKQIISSSRTIGECCSKYLLQLSQVPIVYYCDALVRIVTIANVGNQ